jgi:hypothetical protein
VGPERWARRLFLAHGAVTPLIAVVYFHPRFSMTLLMLALPWGITAPGAILMLMRFFGARIPRRSLLRERHA